MIVVDVGNSRIKFGLCGDSRVSRAASLDDDPDAWRGQLAEWRIEGPQSWAVAGVDPKRRDYFADWLKQAGHSVRVIDHFSQLPLPLAIDSPETAGIDRLLNVLAAKGQVAPATPVVVVDVGTAVTVDLLDESGAFAGGSIFPGLRLMAEALHDYTAALPLVKVAEHPTGTPAKSTVPAIASGVHWAVVGGIAALVRELHRSVPGSEPLQVFLTGGDAPAIEPDLPDRDLYHYELQPRLTLEGIRIAASHLP
jgi:type III pantothenate kinase